MGSANASGLAAGFESVQCNSRVMKRVKCSLCIIKHYDMKTCGGVDI
jgi:hypothetical protein